MSLTRRNQVILPIIQGLTGAAEGAISGAIGSSVVNKAQDNNISVGAASAAGAAGGAVLGAINGVLETTGFFKRAVPATSTWRERIIAPYGTVGFNVLSGMLGSAMLNASQNLDWQTAAVVLAVGASIFYVPKLGISEFYHQHFSHDASVSAEDSLLPQNNSYFRLSAS